MTLTLEVSFASSTAKLQKYPEEEEFQGLENEITLLEEKKELDKNEVNNIKKEIINIIKIGIENEEVAESEIENYESETKELYKSMLNEY